MLGEWNGEYWFLGRAAKIIEDRKTKFQIIITELQENNFSGNVTDDLQNGGMKGIGQIKGVLNGSTIKFTKQMPISTLITHSGDRIEENKPHRPIYYSGTFSSDSNKITGTWVQNRIWSCKRKILFFSWN